MSLCTLNQAKLAAGLATTDTEHDTLLTQLVAGVSADLAAEAGRTFGGRPCLEHASRVDTFSMPRARRILWLPARPIVSVSEVIEAMYGAFADATALTANEGYQADSGRGCLHRIGWWMAGTLTVRVTYVGGYTPPSTAPAWLSGSDYAEGDLVASAATGNVYAADAAIEESALAPPADTEHWTLQSGQVALPEDLAGCAADQVAYRFQRKGALGVTSSGGRGGSFSGSGGDDLLPRVRAAFARLRPLMGAGE